MVKVANILHSLVVNNNFFQKNKQHKYLLFIFSIIQKKKIKELYVIQNERKTY